MGIFKCDNPEHDKPFTTDNLKEWQKHKGEHVHRTRGVAPCAECGAPEQQVNYEGKIHGNAATTLCSACRAKIGEGMKKAESH